MTLIYQDCVMMKRIRTTWTFKELHANKCIYIRDLYERSLYILSNFDQNWDDCGNISRK